MSKEVTTIEQQYSVAIFDAIKNLSSNPDVNIEKMQRLLDVQERIMAKEAEVKFNTARAEMQKDLPNVYRSKYNNHTKAAYAGLDEINKQVLPVLAKHGFSVRYTNDWSSENKVIVTAILSHVSGHSQENTVILPYDGSGSKNQVQAIGSSITYAERYAICGLLNITLAEDTDGNDSGSFITNEQAVEIDTRLRALPNPDEQIKAFKRYMKVDDIQKIPAADFQKGINAITQKEKKK